MENNSRQSENRTITKARLEQGISIRVLNIMMAVFTLAVSVVLLVTTYQTNVSYDRMREHLDLYIRWQSDAHALQNGSDYLTEQVRCFVETGEERYMTNYLYEVNVSRRRDDALDHVRAYEGDLEVIESLQEAMDESVALMKREYYAMRLTAEAYGFDLDRLPVELRNVALSPADAALTAGEKAGLARSMVFDEIYLKQKAAIYGSIKKCLGELSKEIEGEQIATSNELDRMLSREKVLIFALIAVTLVTMLLTLFLVISPLLRAVVYIRAEQPIPITGSYEFQFLARTYNLMYEASQEQKKSLVYETKHDRLTGVYNRRGYEFLMANVDLSTAALLLFDLDKFKQINDSLGHTVGDRILKRVAETLRKNFRSEDYVCRIGGDEFVVIMVHVDDMTAELIERKAAHINRMLTAPDEELPPISLSCGAAFGAHADGLDALFQLADRALYEVKNRGGGDCEVK